MIRVHRLTAQDPLAQQEEHLRDDILLKPIGFTMGMFRKEFPSFDKAAERFVAVFDHPTGDKVVGCVALLPHHPRPGVGKLMQMCVDTQMQRSGVGRKLVAALEKRAFGEIGLIELFCHARADAVPYYEKLGWVVEGDKFMEAGVEHYKMTLRG
ncbi:MAG: GNAT family N-acetyltransferase [Phycisphaerales bacterium]|nr:MAG: GNAT family N-acetyltransferase [Phycisphaerales bacterium]